MNESTTSIAPVFQLERIYIKDMSIEVPAAPQCYYEQLNPEITIQLQTIGTQISDILFEVGLKTVVTATAEEKTVFLVEVLQAGVFRIEHASAQEVSEALGVACPNILLPFAREAVATAVSRTGFPAVLLAPANFAHLYQQHQKELSGNAIPPNTVPGPKTTQ